MLPITILSILLILSNNSSRLRGFVVQKLMNSLRRQPAFGVEGCHAAGAG
jgi:hypothetical protein